MNLQRQRLKKENVLQKIVSKLFPPELPGILDTSHFEYYDRMARKSIDNPSGYTAFRLTGPAKEKRVIRLGPRTIWE